MLLTTRRVVDALLASPIAFPRALRASVSPTVDESSPDAALMRAIALEADKAAFTVVFRRYGPKVKAFLLARGAAGGVADELTQEVMLTIWRKAALYDASKGSLVTWIYTIGRNHLLNHFRAAERRPTDVDVPDRPDPPDDAAGSEQRVLDAEQRRALAQSVAALPPEQREVLIGAYWNGQTLQECAEQRKIPLGTVKSRARLALVRLRQLLDPRRGE